MPTSNERKMLSSNEALKELICDFPDIQSGYTRVDNDLDLRRTMSSYYSRFALTGSDDPVTFTVPYIDKFGLGVYNFDLCTLF